MAQKGTIENLTENGKVSEFVWNLKWSSKQDQKLQLQGEKTKQIFLFF